MDVRQKFKKAKIQLLISHPFFSTIILPLREEERRGFGAVMGTDGVRLLYDPEKLEPLDVEEIVTVLAHEALHIALLHPLRRQDRNPTAWNMACDYAVNALLASSGFKMPEKALYDPAFSGMYAEEIYDKIFHESPDRQEGQQEQEQEQDDRQGQACAGQGQGQDQDQPQEQGQGSGQDQGQDQTQNQGQSQEPGQDQAQDPSGYGAVMDPPPGTDLSQLEAEIKRTVALAAQVSKNCGSMPAGLERLVEELLYPKLPWSQILRRYLNEILKTDYTWSRPNRRYLWQGLYLPSLHEPAVEEIVVAIDTSGSISQRELDTFAAEISAIARERVKQVRVIYCDCEVQGEEVFQPHEPVKLHPKGGGGTSFVPVFEHVEEHNIRPSVLIYLTDLECSDFPKVPPPYPVLWVSTQKHRTAPWGEIIHMEA